MQRSTKRPMALGCATFIVVLLVITFSRRGDSGPSIEATASPRSKVRTSMLLRGDDPRDVDSQYWSNDSHVVAIRKNCPQQLALDDMKSPPYTPRSKRVVSIVSPFAAARASSSCCSGWKIPNNIVQTAASSSVPREMWNSIEKVRALNPEFNHYFFDDALARDFIKANMPHRMLRMFDTLVPGPFKADVFRYVFLYVKGGVYIDADMVAFSSISELLKPTDKFVLPVDKDGLHVDNSFIASEPQNAVLFDVLENALKMYIKRDGGITPSSLTGNDALTAMLIKKLKDPLRPDEEYDVVRLLNSHTPSECGCGTIGSKGSVAFHTTYSGSSKDKKWFSETATYDVLWSKNQLFATSPVNDEKGFSIDEDSLSPSCPYGLTNTDARLLRGKGVPIRDQILMQVPLDVAATVTKTGDPKKIPRTVLQVGNHKEVPRSMWNAMKGLRRLNPEYSFRYVTVPEARHWIAVHTDNWILTVFDKLASSTLKLRLFVMHHLYQNGGFYINNAAQATTAPLDTLTAEETDLVVPSDGTNFYSVLIAAAPENPVIFEALQVLVADLENVIRGAYVELPDYSLGKAIRQGFPLALSRNLEATRLLRLHKRGGCKVHEVRTGHSMKFLPFLLSEYANYTLDESWYPFEDLQKLHKKGRLHTDKTDFTPPPLDQSPEDNAPRVQDQRHLDREALGRKICPFGQTEVIAYHPPPTPPEERVMILMPRLTPAKMTWANASRYKIPFKMLQTGKRDYVPLQMYRAMQENIAKHPEWEHHYYSDDSSREFIREHFNETVGDAFDDIIPGAYKSDLFRYIWLSVNGGMYIDADQVPVKHVEIDADDEFVSAEDNGTNEHLVYNAIILTTPHHPIIEAVLRDVLNLIETRSYSTDPLAITGPAALKRAFVKIVEDEPSPNKQYSNSIRLMHYSKTAHCSIGELRWNEEVQWLTRYPEYKREMKWWLGQGHYWTMYWNRQVYQLDKMLSQQRFQGVHFTTDELREIKTNLRRRKNCIYGMTAEGNILFSKMQSSRRTDKQENDVLPVPPNVAAIGTETRGPLGTPRRIPLRMMQICKGDKIPKKMLRAIQNVRDSHPKMSHHYFSIKTARAYIKERKNATILEAFDSFRPFPEKRRLFTMYYLLENGGFSLVAGGDVPFGDPSATDYKGILGLMSGMDEFVALYESRTAVDIDFVAAAPGNSVLNAMLVHILRQTFRRIIPPTADGYTGSASLGAVFSEVVGKPGPSFDYGNGVRLLNVVHQPHCYLKSFQWQEDVFFHSAYDGETEELGWYLSETDNVESQHKSEDVYGVVTGAAGKTQFFKMHGSGN